MVLIDIHRQPTVGCNPQWFHQGINTVEVQRAVTNGECDARPHCTDPDSTTLTTATTTTQARVTETATFPITADAWIEHTGTQGKMSILILAKEQGCVTSVGNCH